MNNATTHEVHSCINGNSIRANPDGTASITTSTNPNWLNIWGSPEIISTEVFDDRIEIVYKEYRIIHVYPSLGPDNRVFKKVFSCVDGKWKESAPIYGTIIPATKEDYDFSGEEA